MTAEIGNPVEECLGVIAFGVDQRKRDDLRTAGRAFAAGLLAARDIPVEEGRDLRALALYNLSLLEMGRGKAVEARQVREHATALLGEDPGALLPPHLLPLFQELMADVLTGLGEYRLAIQFCEASVENAIELLNDPVSTAAALWRAGKCYGKIGLRDHAAIPLRAAVKIFRTLAGDPRLPAVLLDLGNALRKRNQTEAEQCYREAADFHIARTQLESAAPAWVNLGVLCNEQGRYAESLAYYERALHVREQSPGTSRERLGVLLNNMANTRRRMREFDEAHRSADRARELLEPAGGHSLACAYGTKGLIFRDLGLDQQAVEWFRKSAVEHQKQPSPNLSTLCEELENEAAALERLGMLEESRDAHRRLESVRATMASVAAVDREFEDPKPPAEGAVLVELSFGRRDVTRLQRRLHDLLEENGCGFYGGRVAIPEATTLMFYGQNAEAMFSTIYPLLEHDPLCVGSKITVRQGERSREVLLPGRVM
jgi:tetratricopeptide (TPR) repeat protein